MTHVMSHATCHVPRATWPRVTCHMPHATCHMPHATCHMPHATCHMPHATCRAVPGRALPCRAAPRRATSRHVTQRHGCVLPRPADLRGISFSASCIYQVYLNEVFLSYRLRSPVYVYMHMMYCSIVLYYMVISYGIILYTLCRSRRLPAAGPAAVPPVAGPQTY